MQRLTYLDALRGMAAALVVIEHLAGPALGPSWMRENVLDLGKLGVLWFFLLSGVVVPFSIKSGPSSNFRFCWSRFWRLYPAYWWSLLTFGLVALFTQLAPVPGLNRWIANASMLQFALGVESVQPVYWTLIVELVFYGLCLLLHNLRWLADSRVRAGAAIGTLLIATALAVARGWLHRKFPVAIPLGLSLMFFGSIWRDVLLQSADRRARSMAGLVLGLFALLLPVICVTAYSVDLGFHETWTRYLATYAIAIGSFLLLTAYGRPTATVFTWLGTISYSMYLQHLPVWYLVRFALSSVELAHREAWVAGLAIPLTLVWSWICYRIVELPAIRVARYWDQRWFSGAPDAAVPLPSLSSRPTTPVQRVNRRTATPQIEN